MREEDLGSVCSGDSVVGLLFCFEKICLRYDHEVEIALRGLVMSFVGVLMGFLGFGCWVVKMKQPKWRKMRRKKEMSLVMRVVLDVEAIDDGGGGD